MLVLSDFYSSPIAVVRLFLTSPVFCESPWHLLQLLSAVLPLRLRVPVIWMRDITFAKIWECYELDLSCHSEGGRCYQYEEIQRMLTLIALMMSSVKRGEVNPWFRFSDSVKKYPTSEAIWFRGRSLTMSQVHASACQDAAHLSQLGVNRGQTVALYMKNSPEYMIIWLACWAIGATPAMISYSLVGDALAHVLEISKAIVVFSDADIVDNIYTLNTGADSEYNVQSMTAELKAAISKIGAPIPDTKVIKNMDPEFAAMLLYTRYAHTFI